jgi:transcriptional regulator with XRE-family HTH domain
MTTARDDIHPEDQDWLQGELTHLTFAAAIKAHRKCEEWTQQEAAERLGITKQLLSAYEHAHKLPSPSKAYEIAKALGMEPRMAVLMVMNDQLRQAGLPLQVALAS